MARSPILVSLVLALFLASTEAVPGIWIGDEELAALPTSGDAWDSLLQHSDGCWETADLDDHGMEHDIQTLAAALVAARLGLSGAGASYRKKAADGIMDMIGTDGGDSETGEARNIVPYVIAADLIDFGEYRTADELVFRRFIADFRFKCWGNESIYDYAIHRANNKGTFSMAAYLVMSIYLRDHGLPAGACRNVASCNSSWYSASDAQAACADPARGVALMANVFQGFLGNRAAWDNFRWRSPMSWHCDEDKPVGINPKNCRKQGHDIGGVLPADQRRGGGFEWPPPKENYVWTGLQGVVVTATVLHREGYPAWEWEDQAIRRAFDWLYTPHFLPSGKEPYPIVADDECLPFLVNYYNATDYPTGVPCQPGKNFAWTDWTHSGGGPGPCPRCSNGIMDCDETGIDCGVSCAACPPPDPPTGPSVE